MKRSFWLFGAIFSLLCVSCEDTTEKTKTNVTGYWSVGTAFRDKRETRLLADVFFQFGADGKMFTNLPNTSDGPVEFEVKDDFIVQKLPTAVTYKIQEMSDSTMILLLEMNNTPFEIHLRKTLPPSAVPVDTLQTPTGDTLN